MAEKNVTVFVVDDDESVCRGLKRLLKSAGYRVETFTSAQHFLKRIPPKGRSILLLDIRMPAMSGLDLQRKLVDEGLSIPVIFMTAHEDPQAETQALRYGAVAFLKKPFHDEVLFTAIEAGIEASG
jgi:FixJ family two-component response regulator